MRRAVPHILLLLLLLLAPLAASGNRYDGTGVSGALSWRYSDFQADGGGAGAFEANSFAQHYSLFYRNNGNLNGGRGGVYSYLLGAEFTGINNSINGDSDSLSTFKPLYSGQLLVAPGGLPFRLKLYCGDTHNTTLIEDSSYGLQNTLLTPGIATDFSNGKHRVSGATLAVGIKNGSYLGGYRETLSKWPRLLMDYKETEVESFRSKTPQNYRQRNLAFVSLNKKDNWFHYRYTDFTDFLQPSGRGDYQAKSYILGTIDPTLQRAWINLTNWVKISAEGTFTQTHNASVYQRPTETYSTNLYATSRRDGVSASILSSYWRERDDFGLKRTFTVPLSVRKRVDRDTSWQLNSVLDRLLDDRQIPHDSEEVYYLGLRVDTWQSRPYTVAPEARVEVFDGLDGTGSAVEVGVEVASNQARRSQVVNSVALRLRSFNGEGRGGASVDYLEEELKLTHQRTFSTYRLGASEALQFGSGSMDSGFGHRIFAVTTSNQSFALGETSDRDGATLHSITKLYGETGVGKDLTNRLELLFDYLSTEAGANLQWGATHTLTAWAGRTLRYTMTNALVVGEGQSASMGALGDGELAMSGHDDIERTFGHTSALTYAPSRSFNGGVSFQVKSQMDGVTSRHYIGRQDCRYTYFRINGVIRALFTLEEELSYEVADSGDGARETLRELQLKGDYYPTRHFSLGAYSRYRNLVIGPREEDTLTASLTAGWVYPQLALRLIYSQGVTSTDLGDRDERGLKMQFDKTF